MYLKNIVSACIISFRSKHYTTIDGKSIQQIEISPMLVITTKRSGVRSYRCDKIRPKLLELKRCGYYSYPEYERALSQITT